MAITSKYERNKRSALPASSLRARTYDGTNAADNTSVATRLAGTKLRFCATRYPAAAGPAPKALANRISRANATNLPARLPTARCMKPPSAVFAMSTSPSGPRPSIAPRLSLSSIRCVRRHPLRARVPRPGSGIGALDGHRHGPVGAAARNDWGNATDWTFHRRHGARCPRASARAHWPRPVQLCSTAECLPLSCETDFLVAHQALDCRQEFISAVGDHDVVPTPFHGRNGRGNDA